MADRAPRFRTLFDAKVSTASLKSAQTALNDVKNGVPTAIVGAINKTLPKIRTQVVRGLAGPRGYLTIKQANLRRRTFTKKATKTTLAGEFKLMGRPIGLVNFKAKDMRKRPYDPGAPGVRYQIFRDKSPQFDDEAFIATGKFQNRHVFARDKRSRFPISTQFSQRLYDLFFKTPLPGELRESAPAELEKQLKSEVGRVLTNALKRR